MKRVPEFALEDDVKYTIQRMYEVTHITYHSTNKPYKNIRSPISPEVYKP